MVYKVLINNIEKYELSFFKIAMQLRAINYLEEKNALIKEKPEYGSIVCRCEMVTEGEIMDAINRPIGARTMDGIKRRTRAGMGRCQAGFCTPRTMEILSRELGIPMTEITKKGKGSNLLVGKIKED